MTSECEACDGIGVVLAVRRAAVPCRDCRGTGRLTWWRRLLRGLQLPRGLARRLRVAWRLRGER